MLILGQTGVFNWGPLKIWPERGLICFEDARDNSYKTMSIRQALEHVQGLSDLARKSQDAQEYYDDVVELQKAVQRIVEIIRMGQIQGSPDDKTAVADHKRRRKTVVRITDTIKSSKSLDMPL